MHFFEAEVAHKIFEFVDEELWGPKVPRCIGQMRAVAAAQLVVVDDRAAGLVGKRFEIAHVVMGHPGPPVQDYERNRPGPRHVRSRHPNPGLPLTERNVHWGHCRHPENSLKSLTIETLLFSVHA